MPPEATARPESRAEQGMTPDHLRGSEAFGRPFAPIVAWDMGFAPGRRRMTPVDGAEPGPVAAPQRAQSPGQRMPVALGQSPQPLHQRSIVPDRPMSVTIAVSAKAAEIGRASGREKGCAY